MVCWTAVEIKKDTHSMRLITGVDHSLPLTELGRGCPNTKLTTSMRESLGTKVAVELLYLTVHHKIPPLREFSWFIHKQGQQV